MFSFLHVLRLEVTCDVQNASNALFGNASFGAVTLFLFFHAIICKASVKSAPVLKLSTVPSMLMWKFGQFHAVLT